MSDPRYEHIGDIVDCAIEECAELIHILSKVKRFGWDSWHPDDPNQTRNYINVEKEIMDVRKRLIQLEEHTTQFKRIKPTNNLTEEENIQMITDFIKGFKV